VAVVVVACLAAGARPESTDAAGIKDAIDGAICTLVESEAGAAAGRKIIVRLSGNRVSGTGTIMSVAIWSAQQFCPIWVPRVTGALSAAFRTQPAPTAAPSKQDVAVLLRQIQANGVVLDLQRAGIPATAGQVRSRAGGVCRSLRQGRDPGSLGRELAGSHRVTALAALSGILGLTKNCAYPPAPWQLDAMSAALATTLVANTFPRDVEPPIVALGEITQTPGPSGLAEITLTWIAVDLGVGGVTSEPWFRHEGEQWKQLRLNLARQDAVSVWAQRGVRFQFAFRAVDKDGNASPFVYSTWYKA
jgi:hypothetical protein